MQTTISNYVDPVLQQLHGPHFVTNVLIVSQHVIPPGHASPAAKAFHHSNIAGSPAHYVKHRGLAYKSSRHTTLA